MRFLDNVPEQNVFVLSNGARINNLEELLNVLSSSDESLFYNHVTSDRNDFANWIKFVIHHEELYNKIINVKNRITFIDILDTEIDYIKNPKLKETAAFFSENLDSEKISANVQPKSVASNSVPSSVQNTIPDSPLIDAVSPALTPITSTAAPNNVSNNVADMFKPVVDEHPNEHPDINQNISLAASESPGADSVDSGLAFSDFEQVLSVIIAEINTEIFSD